MNSLISPDLLGPLLQLFVAVPLLAAGLLVLVGRRRLLQTVIMFIVLVASLAASVLLILQFTDGSTVAHGTGQWPFGVAIPFVADMFTALMLTTTGLLAVVCSWFAVASGYTRERFFAPLVLVLMTGVNGTLLTADLFNFFVFIEVMLLPSYGLYVLTTRETAELRVVDGVRLYVSANLFASTMLLAGVAFVYGTAGTVNLGELAGVAAEDPAVAIAMAIVLLSMMVKASVVPIHSWLARTYPYTSPAVTALISGLHTKVGVYAIYRFYAVVFDGDSRWLWIGVALFTVTMLIGVLGAVGEKTTREILVFHMVSQLGYILMGVALFTELGLTAGIFYLIHHMLVKASLFMSTGAIEVEYGTGEIGKLSGIVKREPVLAVSFFVAALSLAGIPPFSGFVAKVSLMIGAWDAGRIIAVVVMVIVSLITLLSMLKIWGGVFWGDRKEGPAPGLTETKVDSAAPEGELTPQPAGTLVSPDGDGDGDGAGDGAATGATDSAEAAGETRTATATGTRWQADAETDAETETAEDTRSRVSGWLTAPSLILAVATIAIGLGAEVLLSLSETAANGLLDTSGYVEAVRNS
ncbi:monovalent cation/H+ antiporter subunit D family protein [Corynebacterium halotolerans]|uniref:Putative monovalent cation/H+ antiporter subunit D n=1 Tax=Corynebacterium halotolerans YIM 70093 = DSM 44683 TaxID=1121362 RepID=M1NZ65_9CORY|nr:monovalent cation/H+ antiporter subunit D family protein [Corynebacterium halotolerans]AGF72810.1 putative monovalent cation/H+ antiporter subunit D [Corynebacterium halotolerans YIM 70093 = DSM 44683]